MSKCYDVLTFNYERSTKESKMFCRFIETYSGGFYNIAELTRFLMCGWGLFFRLYKGYTMEVCGEFTWYIKYEDVIVQKIVFTLHLD